MFNRFISLIGENAFKEIEKIKILIIGLGGVGGYALEAIVRSGIKNITICDGDVIDITNLNRQIITNKDNIALSKCLEAKKRALSINNDINMNIIDKFITEDNFNEILNENYDYVIDACDDLKIKLLFIKNANKYKLISSMGTANKFDATKFKICKLSETKNDPIARILRKKVKDNKINTKFMVVSSDEQVVKNEVLGTNSYIPGIAGLMCASYVINDIIKTQKN